MVYICRVIPHDVDFVHNMCIYVFQSVLVRCCFSAPYFFGIVLVCCKVQRSIGIQRLQTEEEKIITVFTVVVFFYLNIQTFFCLENPPSGAGQRYYM